MKQIQTLAVLTFGPGEKLGLDDAQVSRRQHVLKDLGDGIYETLDHVQFKAGEVIGYDGVIPKAKAAAVLVDGQPLVKPQSPKPRTGPLVFIMPPARDIPAKKSKK